MPGARRGRAQDPAARQDPRTLDQAELDGATQDDRLAVVAADVADGRDPGPEHRPGRVGQDEPAQLARARVVAVERWRRAEPGTSFRVARDWAWASIRPGISVRPPRSRASAGGAPVAVPTAADAAVGDGDARSLDRCAAAAIDETGVPERPRLAHRRRPGGPFAVGAASGPVAAGPPPLAPARLVPAPAPRPRTSGARSRRARPLDRSSSRTGPIRTRTSRSIGAPTAPNIRRSWRFQPCARIARYQTRSPGGGATSATSRRVSISVVGRRPVDGRRGPRRAGCRP